MAGAAAPAAEPAATAAAEAFQRPGWGAAVADAAQAALAALPPTGKPQPHEHTVMAAVLVSSGDAPQSQKPPQGGAFPHAGAAGR
jgi:hypothetical protein